MHLSTSFAVPMDDIALGIQLSKAQGVLQAQEKMGNVSDMGIFEDWEEAAPIGQKTPQNQRMEQQQIRMLGEILKHSRLFEMMLILEKETPSMAKQLSSMSILYEMKAINQTLSQMFSEVKTNNQLIKQIDWPRITTHCNALDTGKNNE